MSADYRQQQELDEERFMLILGVLQRVSRGTSTEADALFLASELGLKSEYRQQESSNDRQNRELREVKVG